MRILEKQPKPKEYVLDSNNEEEFESNEDLNEKWKDKVLQLINQSSPKDFEKLCGWLLRESGFINVSIEGRPNDGGIDGFGVKKSMIHSAVLLPDQVLDW
ncbi:MAG: restriction endonuclease [Sporolactobacillus sp.]